MALDFVGESARFQLHIAESSTSCLRLGRLCMQECNVEVTRACAFIVSTGQSVFCKSGKLRIIVRPHDWKHFLDRKLDRLIKKPSPIEH